MQCPHCKGPQPAIEKLTEDDPNAKLMFENFPLPDHAGRPKLRPTTIALDAKSERCFWKFVASGRDAQADITAATADEKLTALADKACVTGSEIAVCAAQG